MRLILLSFLPVLLLCGCVSADQNASAKQLIGSYLDQDGMEYSVITGKAWRTTFARLEDSFRYAVMQGSSETERQKLLRGYFYAKMFSGLTGLENSAGCGYSSDTLDENYIHSRFFLACGGGGKTFIMDELLGTGTIDTQEFLRTLPAGTTMAFSVDLKPEALLDIIGRTGDLPQEFAALLPPGLPLRDLAISASGRWQITIMGRKNFLIRLDLPDNNGKLFDFWRFIVNNNLKKAGFSIRGDRMTFPGVGVIIKGDKRVTYYSSEKAEKRFTAAPLRQNPPAFAALGSRFPERTMAMLFADLRGTAPDTVRLGKSRFRLPATPHIPVAVTLTREKDGWLLLGNSDTPVLTQLCDLFMVVFRLAGDLAEEKTAPEKKAAARQDKKPAAVRNNSALPENCICQENLAAAAKYRQEHPDLKPGFYRVFLPDNLIPGNSYDGFDLLYFGDPFSTAAEPLFISKPHGEDFFVYFSDGKTVRFHLTKPDSYRRIIGFLQTVRNYDEKIFRKLIDRADKFDRIQREM